MGKKQRAKLAKAADMPASRAANGAPKTLSHNFKTDSRPFKFLDLPREVRDKIYEVLLIKKLSAEDQKTYDIVKSGRFAGMEHEIQSNSEYYEQELSICLDNESPCPTLKPGLALLFVKKQIHDEASKCLYSKNTFGVALNDSDCHSPWASIHYLFDDNEFPTMSRKNFGHIENFIIMVQNTTSLDDPKLLTSTKNCEDALGAVIASIYYHGNKSLKMLRVRYSSCFEGMIELRREILEHSRTGPPEEAMLKDCNTGEILFGHTRILNILTKLTGRVEDPIIHGDIRLNYINELTAALSNGVPSARTVQRERQYYAAQKAQRDKAEDAKKDRMKSSRPFWEGIAAKYPNDERMQDMVRSQMRMEQMPADVMAAMFRPPTAADFKNFFGR